MHLWIDGKLRSSYFVSIFELCKIFLDELKDKFKGVRVEAQRGAHHLC